MYLQKEQSRLVFIFGCTFIILLLVVFFLPEKKILLVDENVHYWQILSFLTGDFKMHGKLTTLPGYHIFLALFGFVFHTGSVIFFRIVSILIASLTVTMFSIADKSVNGKMNYDKILLFIFFPIFFPYYFLIYTDILSMLLFLTSLYMGLKKHYQMAAILGVLNMAVRQNTFFWFTFTFILLFLAHYPVLNYQNLISYLKKSWVFLLGTLLFVLFVFLNKGIAVGDKTMHPGSSFNLSNIFFYMIITGLFICPLKIAFIKAGYFKRHHYLILFFTFILYWFSFEVTHPYNFLGDDFFLRNELLSVMTHSLVAKGFFFVPISASLLLFIRLYQIHPKFFSFYFLFGALSLMPSWLIEQRYYFIHLIILIIYGYKDGFSKYSFVIILIYMSVCLYLMYGIFTNSFFL
jgi:alpha-1,2-glucosyltransferase